VKVQQNTLFISKKLLFSVINVGIFLDTFLHIRYFLVLIIAEMYFLCQFAKCEVMYSALVKSLLELFSFVKSRVNCYICLWFMVEAK